MEKVSTQLFSSIGDFFDKNPSALNGLLAGGGLGLAGGLLAPADDPNDPDDTSGKRVGTRLKHALIGLLAGGAAGGGIGYAMSENGPIMGALPEDDVSPEAAAASSVPLRMLYGGAGYFTGRHFDNKAKAKAEDDFLKLITDKRRFRGGNNLETIGAVREAIEKDVLKPDPSAQAKRTRLQRILDAILRRNRTAKTNNTSKMIQVAKGKNISPESFVDMAARAGIDIPDEIIEHEKINAGGQRAKLLRMLKRNGRALGGVGVGLALPEIISPIYNAIAASDAGAPLR